MKTTSRIDSQARADAIEAFIRTTKSLSSGGLSQQAFVQGGNGFGNQGLIGTTDGSGLVIEASGGPTSAITPAPPGGGSVIAMGANISLSAQANSQFVTSAGNLTIAGPTVILGSGSATAALTINGTAALSAATATGGGGQAVPGTVAEYLVITFRGNARKIPLFAT